jgi:hypothetical protein
MRKMIKRALPFLITTGIITSTLPTSAFALEQGAQIDFNSEQYVEDSNVTLSEDKTIDVEQIDNLICIENDELLEDASLIDEETTKDGKEITNTKTYELEDGTKVIDTLSYHENILRSKNGKDTVSRTRTVKDWFSISITATFQWYTEGFFSYVKCNSMSAYYVTFKSAVKSVFSKTHTTDYKAIGKAKASVEYKFYNLKIPQQYKKGTFTITCTDTGTISDND